MTLIEALALGGSPNATAASEAIVVRPAAGTTATGPLLPSQPGVSEVTRVNLTALQSGELSQNVVLQDGDTIFVPRAETLFVFGQVRNPGSFAIAKDMTVVQALALAGGVTERGALNRVRIIRTIDGKKKEVTAKLDDLVKAGDTIVVPERFF